MLSPQSEAFWLKHLGLHKMPVILKKTCYNTCSRKKFFFHLKFVYRGPTDNTSKSPLVLKMAWYRTLSAKPLPETMFTSFHAAYKILTRPKEAKMPAFQYQFPLVAISITKIKQP